MEIENKPSSARDFVDKMCVKSDKYAESLNSIMHIYCDYCKGKDEVPRISKVMSRTLLSMGFERYQTTKGLYYGAKIKGKRPYTLIRDLDTHIPSKTKEEIEMDNQVPF